MPLSFTSLTSIPPAFFLKPTDIVAQQLLNCVLITISLQGQITGGRIVETESYTHDDAASHSYKGETNRCKAMFLEGGAAYVYKIYGIHQCCNIVTQPAGVGDAVLLRAIQPYWGIEIMKERRAKQRTSLKDIAISSLCRGPGCLTIALEITTSNYNSTIIKDFTAVLTQKQTINFQHAQNRSYLYIGKLPKELHVAKKNIVSSARIGIRSNVNALKRFYIQDNTCVSS